MAPFFIFEIQSVFKLSRKGQVIFHFIETTLNFDRIKKIEILRERILNPIFLLYFLNDEGLEVSLFVASQYFCENIMSKFI